MPDTTTTESELEIAHVLFIDTVGYSRLSLNEQHALFDVLTRIVRSSPRFKAAEAAGKLIRLPTGDGMALVFSESPEAPARCALEIAKAARDNPQLPLRMGIHSGPVSRVTDVNDRSNAAGAGINIAQRVMSCGDAGHILVSKHTADDLAEHRDWQPYLHAVGDYEVKHGARIQLVNLYNQDIGNPELPACLRRNKRVGKLRLEQKGRQILKLASVLATLLVLFFLGRLYLSHRRPDKSIAVLPFEYLGNDGQNSALVDGLHDEILTDLSKVADLKVVSRTSVMQYKTGAERNLREIGRQLGVANVVEGSVQFVGNHVRVTAQLIDAKTDTHLWAEKYDTELGDVFALESEVSEKIVAQLQSRISPKEKAAIEERPTGDLAAYDLYIRAKTMIEQAVSGHAQENLSGAIRLLDQAIFRDPSFALAYYQLAHAHDQMYLRGFDHSTKRLTLAEDAIQSLQRLRPDSGEAHLALAKHLYWGYLDYEPARQELLLARRSLPNNALSFLLLGYIDRRQGRWDQSVTNMEHALELDPRNPQDVFVLSQIAKSHECLRHYLQAVTTLQRALALSPHDPTIRMQLARIELDWRADAKPLHAAIETLVAEQPDAAATFASQQLILAMCDRNFEAATRALAGLGPNGCNDEALMFPRTWCEGTVLRCRGDSEGANRAFAAARQEIANIVNTQPDNGPAICVLGVLDSALGRKDEAIREGRRALELLPVEKDSINGALLVQNLAVIYAWLNEPNLALEQLAAAATLPGYLSYGQLRLDPIWDPLRPDPGFEKIVASLAPKP